MNGLDLFSGIGGIGLALEPWVRTVAYCERDRYAQGVLLSRMQSGEIDRAPIWDDVTTLKANMLPNIDIIFGGFPCQDISVAGRGAGLEGKRSGLFFEIIRLVKEIEPTFVFLENVPAIRIRGLSEVVNALTEIGYDCRWTCITASSVGACHKRERWFLLANSNHNGLSRKAISTEEKESKRGSKTPLTYGSSNVANTNSELVWDKSIQYKEFQNKAFPRNHGENKYVTNTMCEGLERYRKKSIGTKSKFYHPCSFSGWESKPIVCRGTHGIQNRVDRIKCLGNSVVPLQVREAFKKLAGI